MLEQVSKYVDISSDELKNQVILKNKNSVYFLLLNRKANTFTQDFMRLINTKLDEVQKSQGPAVLVTISLSKLFSGGLDLKFTTLLQPKSQYFFILEFINLLGRLSVFPIPTIAIVKGGAVAGGCMFSFAHDYIFVEQKALFACNQVDIGLPLPPGMMSVIRKKNTYHQSLRDMVLFGRKFSHTQALEYKMIDAIFPANNSLQKVMKKVEDIANYGENRINFKKIKAQIHKDIIDACFSKQHGVGAIGQTTPPFLPKL